MKKIKPDDYDCREKHTPYPFKTCPSGSNFGVADFLGGKANLVAVLPAIHASTVFHVDLLKLLSCHRIVAHLKGFFACHLLFLQALPTNTLKRIARSRHYRHDRQNNYRRDYDISSHVVLLLTPGEFQIEMP